MTETKPVLWCFFCQKPHSLDIDDSEWLAYGVVKPIDWPGPDDVRPGKFFMLCDECAPQYVDRDWATLIDRTYPPGRLTSGQRRHQAECWDRLADASVPLEPEQVGDFRATFT